MPGRLLCLMPARSNAFSDVPPGLAVYSGSASRLEMFMLSPVVWLSSVSPARVMRCVTLSRGFKGFIVRHLLLRPRTSYRGPLA